jgi:hypothetical protein
MKTKLLLIFFFSCLFTSSFSQTNSVDLKDGNGVPISQHSSVSEAYNAIPASISQAYIIEILAAYNGSNESFPITLTNRTGSSSSNTITIRPASGNTGEEIAGNSNTGLIILNDADYVIIDGRPGGTGTDPDLKLQNNAASGTNANTIQLINGSSNNIIRFIHAVNATQGAAGPRAVVFATSNTGSGNNDNVIHDCKIEGGRSGIGFAGTNGTPNLNNVIQGCEIYNFGYAGIWLLSYAQKILIEDCVIHSSQSTQTLNTGINIGGSIGDTITIRNNKIYDIQSTSAGTGNAIRGIWHQTAAMSESVWFIYNNFIALPLDNNNAQNIIGIDITGLNTFYSYIYYNSIRIGGTHSGGTGGNIVSAGIRSTSAGANLTMKNNICVNNRTGGTSGVVHTGFALTNTAITKDIDYNCYFADGTNSFNSYWETTGYTNITDYRTAATPDEQNTIFRDVEFVSNIDLHLAGASVSDTNLMALPIAGITTDIDGDPRSATRPYRGADEGDKIVAINPVSINEISYSLSQNYPNPFNPVTVIRYQLPAAGNVKLTIFDILGKEVAILVDQKQNSGSHSIEFNGSDLSSGIYFYKLVAGDLSSGSGEIFSDVKKMTLLK